MEKVIFFIERHTNEPFAYFPEIAWDHINKSCYALNEGHGPCYTEYAKKCRLASFPEYADLAYHLINDVGYDLHILNDTHKIVY